MDYDNNNEALAIVKRMVADGQVSQDVAEKYFPELKESEDERIRKGLIAIITDFESLSLQKNYSLSREDILAWLEKQSEKPQGKSALEAAKEEKVDNQNCVKPTDKVEPKFREGDWVVHDMSDGRVSPPTQIVDMTNKSYVFDTEECFYFSDAEEVFRKWTIQDAKDGDVLSYRDGQWIYLYKEKIDDSSFDYHILYSTIHQDLTINDSGFTLLSDAIILATKEQRDLLFTKMKEAGYEWDAEKKELKKVEQELIDESSTFKNKLLELFQKFRYIKEGVPTNGDVIDYVDAHIQELIDTIQNKSWSEEDENMIEAALRFAHEYGRHGLWAWLKGLKDRIQPQTTWKPSDEQMDALEHFVRSIGESGYASPHDNNTKLVYSLLSDLKKLRG